MHLLRFLAACVALALAGSSFAADAPATGDKAAPAAKEKPKSREEALEQAGVKLVKGPATVPLGKVAELKIPAGSSFVGPDSLDRFYQITQNVRGGQEVGVLLTPTWMLFLDYADIGYVKDEDKDKLDGDKLLASLREGQDEANADRKSRGWDELKLAGWATAPHYDAKTNNLKWALNLTSSADGHKQVWINESIRVLGRGGVMNATLVSDTAGFKQAEAQADALLAGQFTYVEGQKYAEFKAGDKVAAIGLSALVLGGAGVMAAKMGLFAKLGVFFGKFWKAFVFVVLAIGAGLKKFFGRLTGAQPKDPSS